MKATRELSRSKVVSIGDERRERERERTSVRHGCVCVCV